MEEKKAVRVIVAFIGTIDPQCLHTTVGDLMALYNVACSLKRFVNKLTIAWSGNLFDLTRDCVSLESIDVDDYDSIVYVCGPITEWHSSFFAHFSKLKKIAVGVSVTANLNPYRLVDAIYIRDSDNYSTFDLALAGVGYPHLALPTKFRSDSVSTCLVGAQDEYGELDGSGRVAALLGMVAPSLECVSVQTVLDVSRPIPASVELDLQVSSVVVTTRMHASLLAIYHGVPLLAIDQIKGSAKVTRMLSKLGYPVFNVWDMDANQILYEIHRLRHSPQYELLNNAKKKLVEESKLALSGALELIKKELS